MTVSKINGVYDGRKMTLCPVCQKWFWPAMMHAYKIPVKNRPNTIVCSYSCMRKGQADYQASLKKRGRKRKTADD